MADVVVRVDNLGKKYRIWHQHERQSYITLRDGIAKTLAAPRRWLSEQSARRRAQDAKLLAAGSLPSTLCSPPLSLSPLRKDEDFWALRDVSFEVRQGEVL